MDEWQARWVFWKKTLDDGTRAWGLLMRHREDGHWAYRHPTAEEEQDYISRTAW